MERAEMQDVFYGRKCRYIFDTAEGVILHSNTLPSFYWKRSHRRNEKMVMRHWQDPVCKQFFVPIAVSNCRSKAQMSSETRIKWHICKKRHET